MLYKSLKKKKNKRNHKSWKFTKEIQYFLLLLLSFKFATNTVETCQKLKHPSNFLVFFIYRVIFKKKYLTLENYSDN